MTRSKAISRLWTLAASALLVPVFSLTASAGCILNNGWVFVSASCHMSYRAHPENACQSSNNDDSTKLAYFVSDVRLDKVNDDVFPRSAFQDALKSQHGVDIIPDEAICYNDAEDAKHARYELRKWIDNRGYVERHVNVYFTK